MGKRRQVTLEFMSEAAGLLGAGSQPAAVLARELGGTQSAVQAVGAGEKERSVAFSRQGRGRNNDVELLKGHWVIGA